MKRLTNGPTELTARDVESIFLQSKVNGGEYRDTKEAQTRWAWPQRTWLKQRLTHVRRWSNVYQEGR